ncbi:SagB family peptide dehydrogenase [Streptacidiphilus sp. P02-A3a]|uniref:SagB family peptide dehydrogenase n=1 Tax=Streptacidiphilus sp. P02-A3a TaxID=2704468 RepID=UPI0015F9C1C8|nr:SagB family peptide dehydrogenase [Streptacidiphilus sp. P02-A3a]QMU70602.1 SagB/ThcOx family dehydrogenase [Streptacidiphilus sp. P02-A3a]
MNSEAPEPDPAEYLGPTETGGAAARRYHARYGSVLPAIDLAAGNTAPRHHPGAPLVRLPFPPFASAPTAGPESLGRLLALLYGVTRIDWSLAGVAGNRPVPSGGGAYPGEVYLATAAGLHHYLPTTHALERLSGADLRPELTGCLAEPPSQQPELILLITARQDANLARYGPFGHRLQALDTGVLAGQALTLLDSAGAAPAAHTHFADQPLNRLLGLDPTAESVHVVVTSGSAADLAPTRAVLDRRSARSGFEPTAVPSAQLAELLDRAALPVPLDHPGGPGAHGAAAELYCVAGRVSGLDPGCHRRDPGSGELRLTAPGTTPRDLYPPGGPGELAGFEAACAVLVVGDYEQGYPLYGDRWYRMLNIRAGIVGQRVGLAAARAGLGAGLRCDFVTERTDAALGAPPGRTALLSVLVGRERGHGAPSDPLILVGGHP